MRVYRRDPARPAEIVGFVEHVGTERTQRFSDVEELNAILIEQNERKPKAGRTRERG